VQKNTTYNSYHFIGVPLSEPRILIPLASPLIQAGSFNLYNPGSIQGKIFRQFGKVAAISGILNMAGIFFAAPIESFKATDTIKSILNNQTITGLQNDWETALGKTNILFALSLGEPNYYRKVTALIYDKNAMPIAFAKVACTTQAKALIVNEAMALEKVASLKCESVVIPQLLGQDETDNTSWVLQSPLLSGRPSHNDLQNEHITLLAEFAQKSAQTQSLNLSDILKSLRVILRNQIIPIKAGFESEKTFVAKLCKRLKALSATEVNKPWPVTVAHGDFAPWNMRLIDGKVALYDWEYFIPLAPAGWDILYFIFRVEN